MAITQHPQDDSKLPGIIRIEIIDELNAMKRIIDQLPEGWQSAILPKMQAIADKTDDLYSEVITYQDSFDHATRIIRQLRDEHDSLMIRLRNVSQRIGDRNRIAAAMSIELDDMSIEDANRLIDVLTGESNLYVSQYLLSDLKTIIHKMSVELLEEAILQAEADYDEVLANFWESLPYDMANRLGEDWKFWDADNLYEALTVDLEEVDEEGFNYEFKKSDLIKFRQTLHKLIKDLTKKDDES